MKTHIQNLIQQALKSLNNEQINNILELTINIEHARDKKFGDFASNIAMVLAKQVKMNPRELATIIIENLPKSDKIAKVEIAGPGFINFYLTPTALNSVIEEILKQKENYGLNQSLADLKIHMEYVSANPTGPLHVGHGRSAAFGSALANVLKANGAHLHTEYYVNDAGRQMDILATSVWLRYLELHGVEFRFPSNAYKGDYVIDIAVNLKEKYAAEYVSTPDLLLKNVPTDEIIPDDGGDKEAHIDGLIANAKSILGNAYSIFFNAALDDILAGIQHDLAEFEVRYDQWFSEKSLFNDDYIYKTIDKLTQKGHTYEKDGNLWFKASEFGDEKDRVVIRKNGAPTYFASDISYHLNKFERGANLVIDVLGADHHGYAPRVKAAMKAFDIDPDKVMPLFVQFAILYRGDERVQMSTRSGSFVTLHDLQQEVGKDAARYFYIMRKNEQHLDFDLELAKSQSSDNPVYYIQYAHARICSVLRQLQEKAIKIDVQNGLNHTDLLQEQQERALIELLDKYQDTLKSAGLHYEPHQICHYLRDLANALHTYYNAHQFIVEEADLRDARIVLILTTQQILQNGLNLLGISAPEAM